MMFRLSLFYAATVGAITLNPWLGVVLTDAGLTDAGAAAVLLAVPVGRLLGGPLWSWVADRTRSGPVLKATAALSAAVAAGLLLPLPAAGLAVVIGAYALTRAPVIPLADATAVRLLGRRYGVVRAVGSAAFLVAVGIGGWLRDAVDPSAPLWLGVGFLAATAALSWILPPLQGSPSPPSPGEALRLLRHPRLWPVYLAAVLHGAAISAYDQLFSVHIEQLGLPATTTGLALATGVAVEIVVLAVGRRWLDRIGPLPVLAVGVAAGVPRYLITGWATDPTVIVLTQGLHGVHFGAAWLAGVVWVSEEAPEALQNTAQSLLPAAMFGVGALVGLSAATVLLQGDGDVAGLYRTMAAASALATAIVVTFAWKTR